MTSNVEVGNGLHLARLGQSVTFECQVMDAFQLDWIAEPVLNSTDPIRFFSGDLINRTIQREHFTGVLTNRSTSSSNTLLATMTVTLSFEARDAFYGIIFLCTDGLSNSSGILFLSGNLLLTFNTTSTYCILVGISYLQQQVELRSHSTCSTWEEDLLVSIRVCHLSAK